MNAKSSYKQERKEVREGVKAAARAHRHGRLSDSGFKIIVSRAMAWEMSKSFEEKSSRKLSEE